VLIPSTKIAAIHRIHKIRPLHGASSIRVFFSRLKLLTIKPLALYLIIKEQVPGSFANVDVSRRTKKSKLLHPINVVVG
jgi:hypothetical protein